MEVHVDSVQQLCVQICQQVLRHCDVLVASVVGVGGGCLHLAGLLVRVVLLEGLLADLDAGRVKRRILILDGANQHDVLEPLEAGQRSKAVKACLLIEALIAHAELHEAAGVAPLLEEPHAGVEQLILVVHVAQVRRPQADIGEELGSVLSEVG